MPNLSSWYPSSLLQRVTPNRRLHSILKETGSITARLKNQCPDLTVQVLEEKWQRPLKQEQLALNLSMYEYAWIRTVKLTCQNTTLLYARTVIPNCLPGNEWFALKQLGTQPLGEVLFQEPKLNRSGFQFACLNSQALPKLETFAYHAYARQSCFTKNGQPLLLTEVFFDENHYP